VEQIKCIIVDDEPLAQDIISEYISRFDFLIETGKFDDALSAMKFMGKEAVDIIFLDIQMPLLDGVNFIKTLKNPPKVIFTTAHRQFAVEGFELNAIDYLVKPIPFHRFVQAVGKIRSIEASALENDDTSAAFFRVDKKTIKVKYSDIQLIESLKDYIRVVLKDRSFVTYQSLAGILTLLPDSQFIQVHKSFIVNFQYVEAMEGNSLEIGGNRVPIGRSYREAALHKIYGTGKKGWK